MKRTDLLLVSLGIWLLVLPAYASSEEGALRTVPQGTAGAATLDDAIRAHDARLVEQLAASGADVNQADAAGMTPLMKAAEQGDPETVIALLGAGARVNDRDKEGRTALMLAVEKRLEKVVLLLLDAGADANIADASGKAALDLLEEGTADAPLIAVLQGFGAERLAKERGYAGEEAQYRTVTISYATSRTDTGDKKSPDKAYGDTVAAQLSFGACQVAIPVSHRMGEVESPSVMKFQFSRDPKRHVTILSLERQSEEEFFSSMRQRMKGPGATREVLVFVHGYNTSFDAAARRMGQMVYDLDFHGVPVLFSWPSRARLFSYADDRKNMDATIPMLTRFLSTIARRYNAETIHVIAHSMGTYGLTRSLADLSDQLQKERAAHPVFNQVILAAPDISADSFRTVIAPRIVRVADKVTLYESSSDVALMVSKRFNSGRRAGDSSPEVLVVKGIDTVDVSKVDTSMIGHSYYGSNETVLADIRDVLRRKKPETRPLLERRALPANKLGYWVFDPRRKAAPEAQQK